MKMPIDEYPYEISQYQCCLSTNHNNNIVQCIEFILYRYILLSYINSVNFGYI